MTDSQDRRNPYTLTLWVLAAVVFLVGVVLLVVGFSQAAPANALDQYEAGRGTLAFQVGAVLAAAGVVLAGLPLTVWAVAREHGVR